MVVEPLNAAIQIHQWWEHNPSSLLIMVESGRLVTRWLATTHIIGLKAQLRHPTDKNKELLSINLTNLMPPKGNKYKTEPGNKTQSQLSLRAFLSEILFGPKENVPNVQCASG
ncbi:unnamed protein product [Brassica napus]|uniref:(rape) hypothetical protein n=1 Tax=Brassica napus TaxID=3708 RepID=A0A816R303_BRANA|nr:unnamed protein product [Brassica napus]